MLETVLAGDFTAVGPLGFILAKQAWLARHRSRDLTYQDLSLDEVQGRPIGQYAAVVTARMVTCWLFGRMHVAWSPSGPQRGVSS